jgi:hypothetical protein
VLLRAAQLVQALGEIWIVGASAVLWRESAGVETAPRAVGEPAS